MLLVLGGGPPLDRVDSTLERRAADVKSLLAS
jgi:hypothetical protein